MKKILSFMSLTLLVAGCADRTMPVADLPEIDTSNPLLAEWETPYATPPFCLLYTSATRSPFS